MNRIYLLTSISFVWFKSKFRAICLPFIWVLLAISCSKSAQDPAEAAQWLTGVKSWKIEEIRVNDKGIFKNGQKIEQFGAVEFSRHMEIVHVLENGSFEGKYNEGVAGTPLKWSKENDKLVVSSADSSVKGGDWYIFLKDVTPDHFVMQTSTTAYDYPNTTKIELLYKADGK